MRKITKTLRQFLEKDSNPRPSEYEDECNGEYNVMDYKQAYI
jgi:hypothetical protein